MTNTVTVKTCYLYIKLKKKKKTYKDREKTEERGVRERGEEEEGVRERENVCFLLPSTRMFVSG